MYLGFLIRWLGAAVISFGLFITQPGMYLQSLYAGIMIAILIGLINAAMPYVLVVASLSKSFFNLLIGAAVVNCILLLILQQIHLGVYVNSMQTVIMFSTILTILNSFITVATDPKTLSGT